MQQFLKVEKNNMKELAHDQIDHNLVHQSKLKDESKRVDFLFQDLLKWKKFTKQEKKILKKRFTIRIGSLQQDYFLLMQIERKWASFMTKKRNRIRQSKSLMRRKLTISITAKELRLALDKAMIQRITHRAILAIKERLE